MSLKKQFLKSRPVCKVTFRLPADVADEALTACVLGDFNGWSDDANPMRRLKDGSFKATIDLEAGRSYQFRYLIDGSTWENDWEADAYVPGPYIGIDNSVVSV